MASTADTADTATDALSEDACEIPAAMRKHVIPRRGTGGEPRAVSPEAARYLAAWLAEHEAAVTAALEDPASEPGLVEEYRACRGDLTAATPRAAAVAGAFAISNDTPAYAAPADVVDAWIGVRGLAFAADATVELFGVAVATSFDGSRITGPQVHHRTADWPVSHEQDLRFELAGRLRAHLATASEPDHARAVEVLTRHRSAAPADDQTRQRLLTAFLLPERTDWVEADLADLAGDHRGTLGAWLAVCALTTADQVASFQSGQRAVWWIVGEPAVLWTGFAGTGNAFLPILSSRLDDMTNPDYVQRLLGVLTCVPSEEALQYLIDNLARKLYPGAALEAAKRFPRRALRLLATAAGHDTPAGRTAAHLLRIHVLAHQDLVRTELDSLDPTARGRVDDLLAAAVRVPDAQTDALPELFVSPPWLSDSGRHPAEPIVIKGLTAPTETVMAWRDGERQEWASRRITDRPDWDDDSLETIAKQIADDGSAHWHANSRFAATAPDALVRSVLPGWRPVSWQADAWVPALVARFGAEALPPVLRLARQHPADCSHLLAPFAAPEAALLAADWLSRLKSARPFALAWLNRHPLVAARTLIPAALGKPGKARDAAELTLRTLAAGGFSAQVAAAAAEYGETVAAAIADLAADDGTRVLPKVLPQIPDWAGPAVLPQIRLRDGATALPPEATGHLVFMVAISKPDAPYPGVLLARELCDPASLAAFAWGLFENWRGLDCPAKDSWAFEALRWFGDDGTVRRLTPLIRIWPGENAHHRAVAGLDVLAAIGGHTALMHLYGIAQKAKFKGLKERATQRITEIAEDLGLSADQLGDRLVPDLGLDSSGTLLLDYGPRQFTVGFDEQLKPYVTDQAGKRVKALPKPGAKDDAALAPAAYQSFSALKKDARTLASDQIDRFELAMVAQRRWTRAEFTEFFVGHPLLRHVVRRLVWGTYVEDRLHVTFRVAEDLSSATVTEDEYQIPDEAVIGIPHPLHFGELIPAWSGVFTDYELLQPFDQLARSVYSLTDEERASDDLTRFLGIDVPLGKVLGLERRGWRRGRPQDAGVQQWISRPLAGGGSVTVALDPGIAVGHVAGFGEVQRFEAVFISPYRDGSGHRPRQDHPAFSALDPITASELLRDLTEVTAG